MMTNTKSGKKPAPKPKEPVKSGKKSASEIRKELGFGDVPGNYDARRNNLELDPALKRELDENKLVARWLNFKQYKTKGFHQSHWVPYVRTSTPSNSAIYSVDPEGYTTYQDLILGVKPKDWNEAHADMLRKKSRRYANPEAIKAQEFEEFSRSSDIGSVVKKGYED